MKKTTKPKSQTAILARKYRVTPRTVRNWRAEGAPLSDPEKLSVWLASRKHIPKGGAMESATATPDASKVAPLETGAAAALKRLEQAEANAYRRLEQAMAKGDAIEIRVARESWLKISDGLRRYEAAVQDYKRDRGLLVSKEEIEKALWFLGHSLRVSSQASIPHVVDAIRDEQDIHRARDIARRLGWYNYMTTAAAGFSALVPLWILTAYCKDLNNVLAFPGGASVTDECKHMGDALRQLAETNARNAIEYATP